MIFPLMSTTFFYSDLHSGNFHVIISELQEVRIAQLDRAPDYGSGGYGFNSYCVQRYIKAFEGCLESLVFYFDLILTASYRSTVTEKIFPS